jgi:hypothetical protein
VNERLALSAGATIAPLRSALLKVLEHKRKQIICFPSAPIHTLQEMQPKCSFHSRRLSRERRTSVSKKKRSAAITTFAAETRVPVWHFQSFSLSLARLHAAQRGAANLSSPRSTSSSSTAKRMNLSDAHFWHFINPPHTTWRCVGSWQTKTSPLMNYFSIVSIGGTRL